MKITIFVSALLLLSQSVFTQDSYSFKLNSVFRKVENSRYVVYTRNMQKVDSVWSFADYNKSNQLVQKGFFTDTSCKVPVGHLEFYQYGSKLYEGNYSNGRPAGYWYFYSSTGALSDSLYYTYTKPAKKTTAAFNTMQQEKEAALKNEHLKKDTAAPLLVVDKLAEFPGGLPAWRQHLQKNLFVPELVMETSPYSKGTVYVQFVVCKDGEVCSIEALNSVHPLADLIAVKAIRKGPKWEPGIQNGKEVKVMHSQPITFIID
jgi:hypothetical protein